MAATLKYLDYVIYWAIVLMPFFMGIAPAPVNVFLGALIAAFLAKKALKREALFTRAAINPPLLFFFLATLLSLLHSINYADSIKGGVFRLLQYIFLLLILKQEIKDRRHVQRIALAMISGLILASIDAFWQVVLGKDFIRGYSPEHLLGLIRASASFKDANTLGIYFSAICPLILGLAFFATRGKNKVGMLFLSAISLGAILLTYSRPTILAIYVAVVIFGIIRKSKILLVLSVAGLLIAPFITPRSVREWARQVDYNPVRFMCNDDRIAIFRNAFNMVRAHPLIGVGANTFMKNYRQYKESPEYRNVVTSDYCYAHNNFLQIAAETGGIGLTVFLWLLYRLFREGAGAYRSLRDNFLKVVSLSFLVGLAAFLVNGFTESSLYYSRVAVIFWYISGAMLALKRFEAGDNP